METGSELATLVLLPGVVAWAVPLDPVAMGVPGA